MATVLTCYYRPKPGGLCKRLFRTIEALLAEGHTVHYLAVEPFPIDHARCHFHRFPWPRRATETLLFWAALHLLAPFWLLSIGLRQGVTHAFAFGHTYAFFMQPLRLLTGVPLSLFLRGDPIENRLIQGQGRRLPRILAAIDRAFEALALRNVRVVPTSQALGERVLARHPGARPAAVNVLPNDIPAVAPMKDRQLASPLRLSCVGILEPRKNMDIALQAVSGLPRDAVTLALFGTGPAAQHLEALATTLGIDNQVTFRGWVPADEVWAETDLLLFPSVNEGLPNAVLEALAYGIPVLAGDIPELRELIPLEHLLPTNDATPWISAISSILSDPKERLGTLSKDQASFAAHLRFDWDAAIREEVLGPP
jgi:glycosyltransferase involved in cell wall biosynthesis